MLQQFADLTYNYSYSTSSSSGSSLGAGFWIGYGIFVIFMYLLTGFILGRVFKKAGRSFGAAFVPFYNAWVLLELGGKSGANIFWLFLPFVGPVVFLVFYIPAMLELGRRFGKSQVFSIFGLVLFSLIGHIILAFDDSRYQALPVANAAPQVPDQPYPQVAPSSPAVPQSAPTDDGQPQPPMTPPTGPVSG